jgi:hypothetical protein
MCCIVKNGRKKTVFNEFLRVFTGSFAPELVQNQGIGDQGSGGGEVEGPREQGNEGPERLVGELVLSLVPKR